MNFRFGLHEFQSIELMVAPTPGVVLQNIKKICYSTCHTLKYKKNSEKQFFEILSVSTLFQPFLGPKLRNPTRESRIISKYCTKFEADI